MGTHIFNTPYDEADPLNGSECIVQRTKQVPFNDGTETQCVILFDSGTYMEVWPEEIQPKEAPCPSQ
jgi:hypothetical protein